MPARNVATRHHRAHRKLMALRGPLADLQDYEIIDPNHRPDLRGEFAGVKVRIVNGKQIVSLTSRQARFHMDQGGLKPVLDA